MRFATGAFARLHKAVAYGDPGVIEIVTDNLFDKIHKDPRWLPFLRKIGKAPEQLAKIDFIDFKVPLPKEGTAVTRGGDSRTLDPSRT